MKIFLTVFLIVASAAAVLAQSPSKILSQAEKAHGGAKALQNVRSISKTGQVTRMSDGAKGKYVFQASQPNLFNETVELNGFETEWGSNGRSGWTRNSRDGLQTLTGDASLSLQARASFRNKLWLNAKNDKSKIVYGGTAAIDGKTAKILVLTTPRGIAITMYFDPASGLLVRDDIPNGDTTDVTTYTDFRPVNGLKQAFAAKMVRGDETYEIHLDDIKINSPIAGSEFDFPNLSGQPLPDIPSLLTQVQSNADKVDAMLDTYSFAQKVTMRELTKEGILREKESETYQMSFYKGHRIRRSIEKNGKPLTEKQQADADKEAGKRVEEIEKRIAKQEAKNGQPSEDERRISIAEMLRASKLLNPRRERFRGRDCVVFDFEPNPSFDPKNAKTMVKFFGKMAGVFWVDEKDRQVARMEAVLVDNFGIGGGVLIKLKKGASFTMEMERVNDEIWLPSQTDLNLSIRLLLVKGFDLNQVVKSYDYRKFATEVKNAEVDPTKKP